MHDRSGKDTGPALNVLPASAAEANRLLTAAHDCCHIERVAYLKNLYSNLCHTSISNS